MISKIKSNVFKFARLFYKYDSIKLDRKNYSRIDLNEKVNNAKKLTPVQERVIKDYWKDIHKLGKTEWKWFEIYNAFLKDNERIEHYIPDNIWYQYVDLYLSNPRRSYTYDDKNMYDVFFHDINRPKTIIKKIDGMLFDNNDNIITEDDAVRLCENANKAIFKLSQYSVGGKGIYFYDKDKDNRNVIINNLGKDVNLVVQEIIEQHDSVARLHPNSVNTVRIMTMIFDGKVKIVSSALRMGVGESKVDNASSGGIVCGILPDGKLRNFAYNVNGEKFDNVHPTSGCKFNDIQIPNFNKFCDLAKALAGRMMGISRLISWDFAVDKEGFPLIIEANLTFGQIDFHQMCNGPIMGDQTKNFFIALKKFKKEKRK